MERLILMRVKLSSYRYGCFVKKNLNRIKVIKVVVLNFILKWIMIFYRKKEKIERKKVEGIENKYFLSCRGLLNEFGGKEWVLGNFICICF